MHSALEKPRITRNGLLLIAAIWLIYSVFYTLLILTTGSGNFLHIVSGILIYSFFFFLYSLPAWILVIRQMDESPWRWRLAAHAVLGVLYAWAVYETNRPIYKSLFGLN